MISGNSSSLNNESKNEKVIKFEPSWLKYMEYNFLSWFMPASIAVPISAKISGPVSKRPLFKKFINELQDSLQPAGGSSEYMGKLIPEYLGIALQREMRTGDLAKFRDAVEHHLVFAYNEKLSEELRDQHKVEAFKIILGKVGPHVSKMIQASRPKKYGSWVETAISIVQSDMPALSQEEFDEQLKQVFQEGGEVEYAKNFPVYFTFIESLGKGTVANTALYKHQASPGHAPQEVVVKFIQKDAEKAFKIDHEWLLEAASNLTFNNEATLLEEKSFKYFSDRQLGRERLELNPSLESACLMAKPYQSPIETVKCHVELFARSNRNNKNVLFMQKAEGIPLNKYLKQQRKLLSDPEISPTEKDAILQELFEVRKNYVQLAEQFIERIDDNEMNQGDLHPGNMFLRKNILNTKKSFLSKAKVKVQLTILDFGATVLPASKEAHLEMQQFIFALYLSAGTGDAHYLRIFYQNYNKNCRSEAMRLVSAIQGRLNQIKLENKNAKVINTEKVMNELMGMVGTAALKENPLLVPAQLEALSRSNQLLSEELNALTKDLAGSRYADAIPCLERNLLGIALKVMLKKHRSKQTNLWSKESWDYFEEHCLDYLSYQDQVLFEKKFIYGIFGLTNAEADMMNILIPSAIISTPFVIFLANRFFNKAIDVASEHISKISEYYRLNQYFEKVYGCGVNETFNRWKTATTTTTQLARVQSSQYYDKVKTTVSHQYQEKSAYLEQGLFQLRNKLRPFNRFVPGMIAGGALVIGAEICAEKYILKKSL